MDGSIPIIADRAGAEAFLDERIGQGRENAKEFLKQNKEIANTIELALRKENSLPLNEEAPAPTPPTNKAEKGSKKR